MCDGCVCKLYRMIHAPRYRCVIWVFEMGVCARCDALPPPPPETLPPPHNRCTPHKRRQAVELLPPTLCSGCQHFAKPLAPQQVDQQGCVDCRCPPAVFLEWHGQIKLIRYGANHHFNNVTAQDQARKVGCVEKSGNRKCTTEQTVEVDQCWAPACCVVGEGRGG